MNTGRLSTHRAPYGNVAVTKTFTNGRYSVTSQMPEGAIEVKHGDWLSKYSAAMYNDLTRIDEFGRIDKSGSLQKILNVNHIATSGARLERGFGCYCAQSGGEGPEKRS
jgi:hypothetical protein